MASMKKNIEIKIQGQKIALKASEEDPALVKEIVALVTERLSQAEARVKSPSAPAHQVAVLALMDLATEYVQAKHRMREFKDRIRSKSDRLQGLLDPKFGLEPELENDLR